MPKGFFSLDQVRSSSVLDGKIHSCYTCGLFRNVMSPKMEPYGRFRMGIMNIGEAPGETEDRRGKPWQGKAGRMLQRAYRELGVDLFKDCLNMNAVNCRPTTSKGTNRTPSGKELQACRRIVMKAIEEHKPKVIILLGGQALESVIGARWRKNLGGISKWRGFVIPDRKFGAWICPVWHPSFVQRLGTVEAENIWMQDLKRALSMAEVPFPKSNDERNQVEIINSPSELVVEGDLLEFDYETTGLKPHAKGHRIVCAAVASSPEHAQVFMMPSSKAEREPFLKLLRDKKIGKMAHNMKFEDTWTRVRLRTQVENWAWDSMLAAHILDNRPGITGLKFQTYLHFGVPDYDDEVAPFLKKEDSKSGNSMNQVLELVKSREGREKLMTYCGMDALFGYRLAMLQMSIIEGSTR